jgi:hypothetical protein
MGTSACRMILYVLVVLLKVIFVVDTLMVPTLMPRGTHTNTPMMASSASTHCMSTAQHSAMHGTMHIVV